MTTPERTRRIRQLLEYLDHNGPRAEVEWHGWQVQPITGGRNNLIYRAVNRPDDLAIKFTLRDVRDRAGRESGSLTALRQAGLTIAPEPILLDRESYQQPVIVLSWLDGKVSAVPPVAESEWQRMVEHLVLVRTVTPQTTALCLPWATINSSDAGQGKQRVQDQVSQIPVESRPGSLNSILRRLQGHRFPTWPTAPVTLCRLDNNLTNYVRRPGQWASVDWEYSGWGDPAFEVANLVSHVACKDVPPSRWQWFINAYCGLVDDETAMRRIPVYCDILVVWWLARLARYLYQIPLKLDERLVGWTPGWRQDLQAKYDHYLALAESVYP